MRISLILLFLFAGTVKAADGQFSLDSWYPSVIEVTQTVAGYPGHLFTKLELAENGDARVTYEETSTDKPQIGTFLMISGRWLLAKGLELEKGREIDKLDIAGLNSQLLLILLSKSFPDGPPPAGETKSVNFHEESETIRVGTTSASGVYPAPWSVYGSVAAVSGNRVNYSLDFKAGGESKYKVHLEGSVSVPAESLVLPDSTNLSGWAIHKIGPFHAKTEQGTMVDYGAKPISEEASTLGELRAKK